MREVAITATNGITAVGHDGRMTAACVRAGIARMYEHEEYSDQEGNPITVAEIRGIEDDKRGDPLKRLAIIAMICLTDLLGNYFGENPDRPKKIHLLLGVASQQRPGPRYEERCTYPLRMVLEDWGCKVEPEVIPHGNASMHFAVNRAADLIESDSAALCVIGGIDSLLSETSLSWFEQAGRPKSASYGRHHGLVAGEAVGFMIVEDAVRAKKANRQVLARITGLGLAKEPTPRASELPSRYSGLTEACHAAMTYRQSQDIHAVFCDLNGEDARAKEWGMVGIRCFNQRQEERKMWHPADCYGDIGAASGALLANIVTQGFVRKWLKGSALLVCSDDHGSCGAMVLEKGEMVTA